MRAASLLCLLALCSVPRAALADLVVRGVEFTADQSGERKQQPRTVVLTARGVRLDQGAESHVVDLQRRQMLILDHRTRTARALTFDELGSRTQRARKEADDALAKARMDLTAMPPKVRAQVEAALRAQKDAAAARQPGAYQRVPTGKSRTVNGFACEDVKELMNADWVGTSCVHRGVELTAKERSMLTQMAQEMGKVGLSGSGRGEFTRAFLDGIPVELQTRDFRTGEMTLEEQVLAVERRDVPDAAFDVPQGYRKIPWDAPMPDRGHAGHGH